MSKQKKVVKSIALMSLLFSLGAMTGCNGRDPSNTPSSVAPSNTQSDNNNNSNNSTVEEKVAVKEVILELSKSSAKVGETVTASVSVKPNNATNKEVTLSSSDVTIAKIEDGKIVCVSAGVVTITARSKDNVAKKAEAKLTVLGADEFGRVENIFEAENATLVPSEGSRMSVGPTDDERVSGLGIVGSMQKGDRLIWGVNASAADDNAAIKFRLMGPSGWLGYWDSIPYNFADWFTIKVNGKNVNTENIHVDGTLNRGGSADYYALKDVSLGNIALKEGNNTITFVLSNRYDTVSINDDNYHGTLSTLCNIDSMTIASSKDLISYADPVEAADADPDVIYQTMKLEAEAANTRVYEGEENPKADLGTATYAEFKKNMNIMFGVRTSAMKAKLALRVAAPYASATADLADVAASSIFSVNVNGKEVSLDGLTIKGTGTKGSKENFTVLETGWIDFEEGDNILSLVVKGDIEGYEYLGGLDYIDFNYIEGNVTSFLNEKPVPLTTYRLEAESELTKRVGYEALADGATYVELKDATKTQMDVYSDKLETTKIIYGVESNVDCYATIKMRVATPYENATSGSEDVSLGSLGDLWVNGTIISTPNTLNGTTEQGKKDNFTTVEIATQVKLSAGKNRIAWEPQNYTGKSFGYFGALDYIEVVTSAAITPYEVNMWTDRNTYFDDANGEPIFVTCDKVAIGTSDASNCWIGLFKADDTVEANCPGSLYYYAPTNTGWNSDGQEYLGRACDITKQNPNSQRPLISATTGGYYKVVYMEQGSYNANSGYDVFDTVYISVWNDPENYGGRVA